MGSIRRECVTSANPYAVWDAHSRRRGKFRTRLVPGSIDARPGYSAETDASSVGSGAMFWPMAIVKFILSPRT